MRNEKCEKWWKIPRSSTFEANKGSCWPGSESSFGSNLSSDILLKLSSISLLKSYE